MPVCVSVTVTLAFGTTAPEASVTVPSKVAFTTCDQPAAAATAINNARAPSKRRLDMVTNSFSYSGVEGPVQPSCRHTRSIHCDSELHVQQNLSVFFILRSCGRVRLPSRVVFIRFKGIAERKHKKGNSQ